MSPLQVTFRRRISARGLTLVELLIALVMGLTLLAGVVTIFVSNKQTYRFQDGIARLQESGRFVMALIARDLRGGGRADCVEDIAPANIFNALNDTSYAFAFGPSIFGIENWSTGSHGTTFPIRTPDPNREPPLDGTDVFTVHTSESLGARVIQDVPVSAQLKVVAGADLKDDDIVMVVDEPCENAAIFQITNFANQSVHHSEVVHNTGQQKLPPGNAEKDFNRSYLNGDIVKVTRASWFVANTKRKDAAGQDITALYRSNHRGAVDEMVEGVEDLQVLYGVDENNDQLVEQYQTAQWVSDKDLWRRVASVRVSFLLRSLDPKLLYAKLPFVFDAAADYPEVPAGALAKASADDSADRRLRQAYSMTVTLRNRVP